MRAVSLGNNHAFDALAPGLGDTVSALESRGIDTFGAGPSLRRAAEPYRADLMVGRRQLRLCVLGALERNWRNWVRAAYATSTGPGTYPLASSTLTEQIRAAKQADPALFVVAFPHWGQNYAPRSPEQSRIGRALLDAGADIVLGHGAHLLQEIEPYRGRLIVHGLGNFVFLSPGRYQGTHPWSVVARLDFDERDGALSLAVVVYFLASDNAATGYQPRILGGDEFERAAQALARREHAARTTGEERPGCRGRAREARTRRVARAVSPLTCRAGPVKPPSRPGCAIPLLSWGR